MKRMLATGSIAVLAVVGFAGAAGAAGAAPSDAACFGEVHKTFNSGGSILTPSDPEPPLRLPGFRSCAKMGR